MSDEDLLRPPERDYPNYPAKYIEFKNGEKMVIRQISREDVPKLLDLLRPVTRISKDYYDIVAARAYSELLGWYRYRVRDEYCLVGQVNGEVVGLVNGRVTLDGKTGISYHTMSLKRGYRTGANLFAAKMEYHIEYLKNERVLVVAESPIGFRRWMEELKLTESNPPEEHELGGVITWILTKENYYEHLKPNKLFGIRPVPEDLMKSAEELIIPPWEVVVRRVLGENI